MMVPCAWSRPRRPRSARTRTAVSAALQSSDTPRRVRSDAYDHTYRPMLYAMKAAGTAHTSSRASMERISRVANTPVLMSLLRIVNAS